MKKPTQKQIEAAYNLIVKLYHAKPEVRSYGSGGYVIKTTFSFEPLVTLESNFFNVESDVYCDADITVEMKDKELLKFFDEYGGASYYGLDSCSFSENAAAKLEEEIEKVLAPFVGWVEEKDGIYTFPFSFKKNRKILSLEDFSEGVKAIKPAEVQEKKAKVVTLNNSYKAEVKKGISL